MIFGELDSFFSILGRIRGFFVPATPELSPAEGVAARLFSLLESHGVHRNQIPRFIGHGLTLLDVQDEASLVPKLTEELLDDVSSRLAVRREWLDGAGSQVYPVHDYYKHPEWFTDFLEDLLERRQGPIFGVVLAPDEDECDSNALLLLQEVVGFIGEAPVYRYHLSDNWAFSYWKARAYLAACVAIAWKRSVYIHGVVKPREFIDGLASGETLLGWKGDGIWELGRATWHPEELAVRPEAFLAGIDPEKDHFGFRAGLELWLDLHGEGLMDAGFGNPRNVFEETLLRYVGDSL